MKMWLRVLVVVVAMLSAACTTDSSDSTSTSAPDQSTPDQSAPATDSGGSQSTDTSPPAPTEPVQLTASWTGVTEATIKIGFIGIDVERLAEEYNAVLSRGPAAEVIQAQVDATNAGGGINGRQVELVTEKFLPVGADDSIRACEVLTTDEEVFLVIGTLQNDNTLCVTELHETPYLGFFGLTAERQERSRAPFVSLAMATDKQRINSIRALLAEGDLEGRRVAVDWDAGDAVVAETVVELLTDAGIDVVATTDNETFDGDTTSTEQALDVTIQRWVAAEAEVVIELSGVLPITLAIQRNNYEPERLIYLNGQARSADFFDGSGVDVAALDFASAMVAAVVSSDDFFADPGGIECLDNYAAAYPDAEPITAETAEAFYGNVARACGAWQLFRVGAEGAGPNLTPDTWIAAVEGLGAIDLASDPGSTFGPDKRDGGNLMQRYEFDSALGQLVPDGEPIAAE